MKKLLLLFVCIFLSNCSYAVLHNKGRVSEGCSALYYTAPVLDTAATAMSIAVLIVLPTAIAYSSSSSNTEAYQFLGTTIISTGVFGSSAVHGYSKVYKCRKKQREF